MGIACGLGRCGKIVGGSEVTILLSFCTVINEVIFFINLMFGS